MYKCFILISCLLVLLDTCNNSADFQDEPKRENLAARVSGVLADSAMVVTASPMATKAGIEILKQGGNAVDAAIAVQFALTVTYPRAGNIGGGGFMIWRSKEGKLDALDFREKAPLTASKDMYLDENKEVVPRLSIDGHLAVGVPGTVDGMVTAHKKYGKLKWEALLQPAIDLAENGFMLLENEAEYLNEYLPFMQEQNEDLQYFVKDDGDGKESGEWIAGDTLKQKDLAETFKLIQKHGRSGFYEGKTADLIVAEMQSGNGIISHQDLKAYQSVWREPIIGNYKEDYRIVSMPPPSSGGVALLQMAEMVENLPINKWGFQHPKTSHTMIESERLAYADRATHLGDSDFYPVPLKGLLDENYLKTRAKQINPDQATRSSEIEAGKPKGSNNDGIRKGGLPKESKETTHFSIVDKWGNAVAITTTLNGNYGSKVVVDGGGFLLNNEMDDFSAKPGVPNQFGLVGNAANAIVPEKRMLSSMTPTIVEKNGELFMVLGTPGGATIITSVFQCFLNVVEFDMSMQEAVNAPRFHHQWLPDTVYREQNAFDPATIQELEKMGHHITIRGSLIDPATIGKVDAILVQKDGKLEGAADIRGEDTALGY